MPHPSRAIPMVLALWALPALSPVPAIAQGSEASLAPVTEAAAGLGWTLQADAFTTLDDGRLVASWVVFERDGLRLRADRMVLRPDGQGVVVAESVVIDRPRDDSRSGSLRIPRLAVSELAALGLLPGGDGLAAAVCARPARAAPLTVLGESVVIEADPDALAMGQRGAPERVEFQGLSISAGRTTGENGGCAVDLRMTADAADMRAADGTRGRAAALALNLELPVAAPSAPGDEGDVQATLAGMLPAVLRLQTSELRVAAHGRDILSWSGFDLGLTQQGLAMAPGESLLGAIAGADVQIAMRLDALDLPLRGLLPADLDLPSEVLLALPAERITGNASASVQGSAGRLVLEIDSDLHGLADLRLGLAVDLPRQAGGMAILPGVPPEVTAMTLRSAEIAWQDRGAEVLVTHFTGRSIADHGQGILRPFNRILSAEAAADLSAATRAWLEAGLSQGAQLTLAPENPVSLAQAGATLLIAPARVPAMLGLATSP